MITQWVICVFGSVSMNITSADLCYAVHTVHGIATESMRAIKKC